MAGAGRAASALMGSGRAGPGDAGSGDAGGEGRARASRSRRIWCCSCWILRASLRGENGHLQQGPTARVAKPSPPRAPSPTRETQVP